MSISIVKPTVGADAGVWGTELNTALDALAGAASPDNVATAVAALQTSLPSSYVTALSAQSFTAGQQAQARANIGVGSLAVLDNANGTATITASGLSTATDNTNGTATIAA